MGTQNLMVVQNPTHVMLFVMGHHRDPTVSRQSEVQEQIVLVEIMMLPCLQMRRPQQIFQQIMKWVIVKCLWHQIQNF